MKNSSKLLGSITIIIFLLLWGNQFIAIKALYHFEQNQWQIRMDSAIGHCVDLYLRPVSSFKDTSSSFQSNKIIGFNPETRIIQLIKQGKLYNIYIAPDISQHELMLRQVYELFNNELPPFSQLDSLLKANTISLFSTTQFIIVKLDSAQHEMNRFPESNTDVCKMLSSKNFIPGLISQESFKVYYNFPLPVFLKKAWNSILTFIILTLLFILLVIFSIYLYRFMRRVSHYQEETMRQIINNWETPLSRVKSIVELLQKQSILPSDEKGIEKITLIKEEINHLQISTQLLLRTLNGIILLKIEKNIFDLHKELITLIEEEKAANANNEEISLTLHYLLPETQVYASRFHLMCAIRNLLDNAIKYGGTSPQIFIDCYMENKGLAIAIKDNGPGIPIEKQKHIFDKYYQVNDKNSPKKKTGYGLGLNYVYNVIKAHNGKITINSVPGEGCTFIIYLQKWKKL